ncbi:MAG: PhoH family protein [Chromatiales bacterium]|nr:PhoH family protein [Chromatiales bacterium]
MNAEIAKTDLVLEPADNERLAQVCGQFDENLRLLERRMSVAISNRGNRFVLSGEQAAVEATGKVLTQLYELAAREYLNPERVHMAIQEAGMESGASGESAEAELIVKTRKRTIRARGINQRSYVKQMREQDLTFGVGPAGTGKTYLAVAAAVEALETEKVRRIILVRPAVEAGERLGFLPGDLAQKVDPYLRPMYDALYEMLGFDRVARLVEAHVIEIAPLAFMRGRTLNESFVILDEAQNSSVEQMKMFLTRIGFGSHTVVTGDITQTDLPRSQLSGLRDALDVLRDVSGVGFTHFSAQDVVRHPLVQRIVQAYERHQDV